jgi:nucleotidyltransferase substrate binding protein (TIGR01987 family)
MEESRDIRWLQRFSNYNKALNQLRKFIDKIELNELEEQGLIKAFEYTYELAWNVIKDFYEEQGEQSIQGSKDAFRLAFQRGLIQDGKSWMEMVENRKLTVHTYDDETANEIAKLIRVKYFHNFLQLCHSLEKIRSGIQPNLFKK